MSDVNEISAGEFVIQLQRMRQTMASIRMAMMQKYDDPCNNAPSDEHDLYHMAMDGFGTCSVLLSVMGADYSPNDIIKIEGPLIHMLQFLSVVAVGFIDLPWVEVQRIEDISAPTDAPSTAGNQPN